MRFIASIAVLAFSAVSLTGCFESSTSQASSESSSDSSSSSSKSSSGDEDSHHEDQAYERDVADVTASRIAAGPADAASVGRDLVGVAAAHGLSDWQSDAHTWLGIGRGLKQAGVSEPELGILATTLSGADSRWRAWIRTGYERATE